MHQINPVPFRPVLKSASGHFQTLLGSFGLAPWIPPTTQLIVPLQDGDEICCEVSTPTDWTRKKPTILLVHGLGGSHNSLYLRRLVPKILELEYRAIRVNLRGCGSGTHLARKTYHGGASEDLLEVIKEIKREVPESPMLLIGFSLGGNISLKLLGEIEVQAQKYINHAIAVCPAIDLYDTAQRLESKSNYFYKQYYLNLLFNQIRTRKELFPEHPEIEFDKKMTFIDFDNNYTSKVWPFKNANHYYDECSAKKYVSKISIPCQILFAKDDPIIGEETILNAPWASQVKLLYSAGGGHMGFLKYVDKEYGFRWMDHRIMQLVKNVFC